jgi:hypothetical protein
MYFLETVFPNHLFRFGDLRNGHTVPFYIGISEAAELIKYLYLKHQGVTYIEHE